MLHSAYLMKWQSVKKSGRDSDRASDSRRERCKLLIGATTKACRDPYVKVSELSRNRRYLRDLARTHQKTHARLL
jgi:hypothetical protein